MNYEIHYTRLMRRARRRAKFCPLCEYKERHHVVPVCLSGSDDESNIVELTPEEHYVAHLLLVKINPGNRSLLHAAMMMAACKNKRICRNNKVYGWLRRKLSKAMSKRKISNKTRLRCTIAALQRPKRILSEDHKRKISLAMKRLNESGWKMPREAIEKTRRKLTGRPLSKEHKLSISRTLKGRSNKNLLPKDWSDRMKKGWEKRRARFGPSGGNKCKHT